MKKILQRKYKLAILFSFFTCVAFSQTVTGVLKNKETQESIPYATVSIGDNYGVITNNEGEFTISVAAFSENDSLSFSSMGFQKLSIALKDYASDIVYLSENINELDKVYVLDRELTVQEILEKINKNIPENYDNSYTEFTVFERKKETSEITGYEFQIKRANFINRKTRKAFNKSMDSLTKSFMSVASTNYRDYLTKIYVGEEDSLKITPVKATNLVNKDKEVSAEKIQKNTFKFIGEKLRSPYTFKAKTGIIKISDSLDLHKENDTIEKTSISPKNKRRSMKWLLADNGFKTYRSDFKFIKDIEDYNYEIKDVTDFNGELVYVISFFPDKRRAKLTGEMFVSAETFAVVKVDYALAEGKELDKMNLKFILGIKSYTDERSGTIIYQKNKKGKYVPKFIKTHTRNYMYLNRPIALTENNPDRRDRTKIKFKILVENLSSYDNEYLFVDNNEITPDAFTALEEDEKGIPLEEISKYDPKIWEGYNIIAPNRAIREYEF